LASRDALAASSFEVKTRVVSRVTVATEPRVMDNDYYLPAPVPRRPYPL
jgi:hypothetical protein